VVATSLTSRAELVPELFRAYQYVNGSLETLTTGNLRAITLKILDQRV